MCGILGVVAKSPVNQLLYDGLQVQHLNEVVAVVCYGTAMVGSAAAAYLLIVFP